MARIIKEYEVRKTELLDGAWALFSTHGYDATPVSAIIDTMGISKGTFYHYFASKEELLDEAVERKTIEFRDEIRPKIEEPGLNALERLNRLMNLSLSWKAANIEMIVEILRVMYRDENLRLRHKMERRAVEIIAPLLARIIDQGLRDGVFETVDANDAAGLILHLGNAYREMNAEAFLRVHEVPETLETIKRRIELYLTAVERILGASKGSVSVQHHDFIDALIRQSQLSDKKE